MAKSASKDLSATNHLTISDQVKRQVLVILSLVVATLVAYVVGSVLLREPALAPASLGNFALGIAPNLLVAIVIFIFLERGIETLHPTKGLPELPLEQYIRDVRQLKRTDAVRVLDTWTFLLDDTYHEQFHDALLHSKARQIEILLVHPYSAGAIKRGEQLAREINFDDELRKNLARLFAL